MPATREDISDLIITNKFKELVTVVICLEDAVGDHEVEEAESKSDYSYATDHAAIRGRSTYRRNDSAYFCPGKNCKTDGGHCGTTRGFIKSWLDLYFRSFHRIMQKTTYLRYEC